MTYAAPRNLVIALAEAEAPSTLTGDPPDTHRVRTDALGRKGHLTDGRGGAILTYIAPLIIKGMTMDSASCFR